MLDVIYYPVSFILWAWHKAFSYVLDPASGVNWALSVVFLVFTLRAILYKPFVGQVRSMRKMQEFQPELQKLRKKYANDKQKQAAEMQRLQKEHGVNPLGGCLPVLVQVPVFIGLFHVLREFTPDAGEPNPKTENYFFGAADVASFNDASFFGAKLGAWVVQGEQALQAMGTSIQAMLIVMIPLMIAAGVFTHITARHSVARQTAVQAENPQTAIMNKLMLYVFPIGVVVGAPFLPLAVLLYWVANNLWTLGQQYVVYRRIDVEESTKREQAETNRQSLAPRPGQKPVRPEVSAPAEPPAKTPGAKPVLRKSPGAGGANGSGKAGSNGAGSNGAGSNGAGSNGAGTHGAGVKGTNGAPAGSSGANGAAKSANGAAADAARGARSGGGSRPPARRSKKRR